MRAILLAALMVVPWAGCIAFEPNSSSLTIFGLDAIRRGDPTPVPANNCPELLQTLNERALTQARIALDQSVTNQYHYYGGPAVAAMEDSARSGPAAGAPGGATASAAAPPPSARDAQVTGTNNQEAAADEADLVKTDGEWTYVVSGQYLYILHSDRVGDIEEHARLFLNESWGGGQLLLEPRDQDDDKDDRLVIFLSGAAPERYTPAFGSSRPYHGSSMVHVLILSLEDRKAPSVLKESWIEGDLAGARLVDGHAYAVVHRWESDLGLETWVGPDPDQLANHGLTHEEYYRLSGKNQTELRRAIAFEVDRANQERLDELNLGDHLPMILKPGGKSPVREPISTSTCRNVLASPQSTGRGFTTIMAFDLKADDVQSSTSQVVGGRPIVYASEDALVLAAPSQDLWWFWAQPELDEATDLQWFTFDGLDVEHRASGRVAGTVQDSFGIDVEGDNLRVATTTGTWGRWWLSDPVPMMNHVAVFDETAGELTLNGIVGGIAPGERIWSARFTPERAYLVTFRQMDPLWVIDLKGKPEVLGELEIPGVSTYIHPLDDDALLTIGLGPGPGGQNLDWSKLQVSLFDISDPDEPRRADVLNIAPPGGGSWSGALDEHKAFTYWDAVETLAVPVNTYSGYQTWANGATSWVERRHSALRLIHVDRADLDLSLRGEIDQDALSSANQGWGDEIQRSYFLGYPDTGPVSVYAISPLGVTSHDLDTLEPQAAVEFG